MYIYFFMSFELLLQIQGLFQDVLESERIGESEVDSFIFSLVKQKIEAYTEPITHCLQNS